ncbi:serine hydrolase [Arenibacter sp. GZD96]|uniref:serine hydrolase n=1 Tax=Aurantibrevibacter litoralis TaxID=3106030 RepID=UPI002AFEC6EB|nr:serine hydrolase [Arenibacter sp. GZD-96]MEA1784744.1 serine hydrolase [Arenibacter sp. GZD-96]
MAKSIKYLLLALICSAFSSVTYYPIDGYEKTGIKRLKRLERIKSGEINDSHALPPGAMKLHSEIRLNLLSRKDDSAAAILTTDASFQKEINALFKGLDKSYSLAIVDISDPNAIRYAHRNETAGYQPGSVGKLAVLLGLFTQLAKLYPDSWEMRTQLLKDKSVKSGVWGLTDTHTVPIYNVEKNTLVKRQVIASDVFTLYEWTDHMLSVSNNGAASIVWREVLLMAAFGEAYPELTEEQATAYFKETPRKELTDLSNDVVNLPLRDLGISSDEWRLGSFFTKGANTYVGDKGGSIGTPVGLLKFLIHLEQGKAVDEASSLEMKRLMYMTDRRIRYAQAPALKDAAVYFKSGSLYKCDRTTGEECGQYKGNVQNFMNSVAIVEHPDNCNYLVVLMTNVLRKNSATDHMYLAANIDKVVKKA